MERERISLINKIYIKKSKFLLFLQNDEEEEEMKKKLLVQKGWDRDLKKKRESASVRYLFEGVLQRTSANNVVFPLDVTSTFPKVYVS